jgi:hypothetical protein
MKILIEETDQLISAEVLHLDSSTDRRSDRASKRSSQPRD